MARPMESTVESCDGGDDRRMEPVIHLESEATSVPPGDLAIVLTGGGARAAYQVGVLRGIAKYLPETRFNIITGVSAGAINAVFLASRPGPLRGTVDELTEFWNGDEAEEPETRGYPPPAQILGQLMNAIFLDVMDEDALWLRRSNSFLARMPPEQRQGYRVVDLVVVRPSRDLGKLVSTYEPRLPRGFRFLTRSLGTRETTSPDMLSLLMFQPDYVDTLIQTGAADAEARIAEIAALIGGRRAVGSAARRGGLVGAGSDPTPMR